MTMRRPRSTREYQSDQSSANLLDGFLMLFTEQTIK
jgi:hypothetical protein